MIKSLVVKGLHGKFDFDLDFNEDINIITGKNGSGKTSMLKIIWYMLAGRTDLLYQELNFSYIKLAYDNHTIETEKGFNRAENRWFIEVKIDGNVYINWQYAVSNPLPLDINVSMIETDESLSSLFFPTFRRIEGGFGISQRPKRIEQFEKNNLDKALSQISGQLNSGNHHFITAISTRDIQEMLISEYYERLDKADKIQKTANQEIADQLKSVDNGKTNGDNNVINELKEKMIDIEKKREELMLPFESLSNIVTHFFQTKGIEISDNISFGEKTDMLSSDKLSGGEKQMLSFLSYNAFTKDSAIFIDEPELSLHVDWQRQLLPTLMKQGTKNQFFIATHSPFIYGMYPDKEIELIPNTQSVSI